MDAGRIVEVAKTWKNVPPQLTTTMSPLSYAALQEKEEKEEKEKRRK
jgi:hypothetical protein